MSSDKPRGSFKSYWCVGKHFKTPWLRSNSRAPHVIYTRVGGMLRVRLCKTPNFSPITRSPKTDAPLGLNPHYLHKFLQLITIQNSSDLRVFVSGIVAQYDNVRLGRHICLPRSALGLSVAHALFRFSHKRKSQHRLNENLKAAST